MKYRVIMPYMALPVFYLAEPVQQHSGYETCLYAPYGLKALWNRATSKRKLVRKSELHFFFWSISLPQAFTF